MASSALEHLRAISNLENVWREFWQKSKSKETSGIDGITLKHFYQNQRWKLEDISRSLKSGYPFSPLRGIALPKKEKGTYRLICIPTVSDRLVQRAILRLIEARASTLGVANDVSYGFVKSGVEKKRGTHAATVAAAKLRQSSPWVFKADISKFFDKIQREQLAFDFGNAFRLKSISPLVLKVIKCEVDTNDARTAKAVLDNEIVKGRGLRQGMPLSPILSNFVLRSFDKIVSQRHQMIRYADDLAVFAKSESECEDAKALITDELKKLTLDLSTSKSFICSPDEPVEFLGMELAMRETGKYGLYVSDEQFMHIGSMFKSLHSWDAAMKEGLDISKLLRRLEQMKSGYISAYSSAENYALLNERLERWQQNCALSVYGSLFGRDSVKSLTAQKRKFLSLP